MAELDLSLVKYILLALLTAIAVTFATTPLVKKMAYKVGAIDVPKDARRMHKTPIPRLGGLAIFLGFFLSVLLFVEIQPEIQGILIGAVMIDRYPTYACKHCEKETGEANVVPTPMEPTVIPGSFASPSAIAHLAVQKYVMYSPLYRLEQEFERQGLKLSRQIR